VKFTDIFIRRPVLSVVISLLIVVLGMRSLFNLPINQFPRTQNAVVTVTTAYYGAKRKPWPASSRNRWKRRLRRRRGSITCRRRRLPARRPSPRPCA
jgi:hypothetical protein